MHEREEWQTVMEVLLSAVEGGEPVRLVQVALTLALQERTMRGIEVDKNGRRTIMWHAATANPFDRGERCQHAAYPQRANVN
jgi:hypothetical protein